MQLSKYNIYREIKDEMYIMNLISESIVKMNKESTRKLKENDFNAIAEDDINFLLERYILIRKRNDDVKTLMLRYDSSKYADDHTYCTLVPTYSCNFSCSYCYQSALCINQESSLNISEWLENLLIFFKVRL